jgi:hypothetical protein
MTGKAQFFHGRKLHYEIYVQSAGRWTLSQTVDDGRAPGEEFTEFDFERLEASVLKSANALLAGTGVQAVKVIRERHNGAGLSLPSEIFLKEAAPVADRSAARPLTEPMPPVGDVIDLTRRGAVRALGIVLRDFLAKMRVTALECLHHHSTLKKLAANASLYQAMVHQVATRQAEARTMPMKEALNAMHRVFDEVQRNARDAQADKRWIRLAEMPFADVHARLSAEAEGDAVRPLAFTAIARRLEGTPSHFTRLAWVFDSLDGGAEGAAAGLLDEFAANCMDDPQMVMDLLGAQPSLAVALAELARLANGAAKIGPKTSEDIVRLNERLGSGVLPLAQAEIWDRVVRSVDGTAPLMRKDPAREWNATLDLAAALKDIAPEELWPRLEAGFEKRKKTLRHRD